MQSLPAPSKENQKRKEHRVSSEAGFSLRLVWVSLPLKNEGMVL